MSELFLSWAQASRRICYLVYIWLVGRWFGPARMNGAPQSPSKLASRWIYVHFHLGPAQFPSPPLSISHIKVWRWWGKWQWHLLGFPGVSALLSFHPALFIAHFSFLLAARAGPSSLRFFPFCISIFLKGTVSVHYASVRNSSFAFNQHF